MKTVPPFLDLSKSSEKKGSKEEEEEERERESTPCFRNSGRKGGAVTKEIELEGQLRVLSKDKRVDKAYVIAGIQSELK